MVINTPARLLIVVRLVMNAPRDERVVLLKSCYLDILQSDVPVVIVNVIATYLLVVADFTQEVSAVLVVIQILVALKKKIRAVGAKIHVVETLISVVLKSKEDRTAACRMPVEDSNICFAPRRQGRKERLLIWF
ncbi:MAG: hypothetical protein WC539_04880 [Nitrospirota bacterium]